MPLRKSPVRTPAFLAANRANARMSSGPRTPCGRARVSLNALKHGRSMVLLAALRGSANACYGPATGSRKPSTAAFGRASPRRSGPGAPTGGARWTNSRPRPGAW